MHIDRSVVGVLSVQNILQIAALAGAAIAMASAIAAMKAINFAASGSLGSLIDFTTPALCGEIDSSVSPPLSFSSETSLAVWASLWGSRHSGAFARRMMILGGAATGGVLRARSLAKDPKENRSARKQAASQAKHKKGISCVR
jgi:hypothetical protein